MTRLFLTSSLIGAMTLSAAIDSGVVPDSDGERVLLVANNATAPELVPPWHDAPAAAPLLSHFTRVIYLNETLYPYLPATWEPRDEDVPMLERLFRTHWSLGSGPLELVVDSIDSAPGSALVQVFRQAPISVLSTGLASYGPSSPGLPLHVVQRLRELIYLEVLRGVIPVFLSEHRVRSVCVSVESFGRVVENVASAALDVRTTSDCGDRPTALIVGQHLSGIELLDPDEEVRLYVEMIDAAIGHGAERVVFKPHPISAPALADVLRYEAGTREVAFEVADPTLPAEAIAARCALDSVVSCFSTALVTLNRMYGVPAISTGSKQLLDRVTPYQDPRRIPLTIVDALTRPGDPYGDPGRMQQLIDTVSFCMQPRSMVRLRTTAEAFLASIPDSERRRYVKVKRLTALGLPGADDAGVRGASGTANPGWMRPITGAQRRLRKSGSDSPGERAE